MTKTKQTKQTKIDKYMRGIKLDKYSLRKQITALWQDHLNTLAPKEGDAGHAMGLWARNGFNNEVWFNISQLHPTHAHAVITKLWDLTPRAVRTVAVQHPEYLKSSEGFVLELPKAWFDGVLHTVTQGRHADAIAEKFWWNAAPRIDMTNPEIKNVCMAVRFATPLMDVVKLNWPPAQARNSNVYCARFNVETMLRSSNKNLRAAANTLADYVRFLWKYQITALWARKCIDELTGEYAGHSKYTGGVRNLLELHKAWPALAQQYCYSKGIAWPTEENIDALLDNGSVNGSTNLPTTRAVPAPTLYLRIATELNQPYYAAKAEEK